MSSKFSFIQQKRFVVVEFLEDQDKIAIVAGKWLLKISEAIYSYWPTESSKVHSFCLKLVPPNENH